VPKVIDFGVAKATEQRLTERTMFTQYGTIVGTFEYMAPEQAEMSQLGVDTRSDIYSLGVLLYELLTGSTPLSRARLRTAALDEVLRLIREEEAPKPSTRLSHSGAALEAISAQRRTEPAKLAKLVRGELDWIVMKALEKDRTRRYETANGLARDVQRYLTDEPVEACPPSAGYKLRKLARKYKTPLRVAGAFAVLLLAGVVVSVGQAVRATLAEEHARAERDRAVAAEERTRDEARKAQTEAAIATAVNDFLQNDLLAQAKPENEPDRDLKLRTLLDRASQTIGGKFDQQPLVEAAIRQTIADTYLALSLWAAAQSHLERAVELRRRHLGEEHRMTHIAMHSLALALRQQGKYAEAESLHRKTLELCYRVLGEDHPDTAGTMSNLAFLLQSQGKLAEAEPLWRKALAILRRAYGEENLQTLEAMSRLTQVLQGQEKLPATEAEALQRKVLETRRRVQGNEHPATLLAMHGFAILLIEHGKLDEAERLSREGLETARRVLGDDHHRTLLLMKGLGVALHRRGDYAAAEPLFVKNLEAHRRVIGEEHSQTVTVMNHLAQLYKDQGKYDQAEPLAAQALAIRRRVYGEDHPATLWSMLVLSEAYQGQGKFDQAEPLLVKRVEISRREHGAEDPELAVALAFLGLCRLQQQRFAEAEPVLRECLATCDQRVPDGWGRCNAQSLLGGSLLGQKKYAEAESLLVQGYEGMKQREVTIPVTYRTVRLAEALERLVQLYEATGRPEQAAEWRAKLSPKEPK
jgi:tetratricopeptide (TPR) repeat protein